ncbi:MAG: hypothetical protein HZB25_10530 [Candidatus Eisenbacteria bacterium]|nr:hypothetical protein [Candidatus Eisenbacteria bacterium]
MVRDSDRVVFVEGEKAGGGRERIFLPLPPRGRGLPPAPPGMPALPGTGPQITGVFPGTIGSAGDETLRVTIRGANFGDAPGRVRFPDWFARLDGRVRAWSDTVIVAEPPVPDVAMQIEVTSGPVEVVDREGRSSLLNDGCADYSCRPASWLEVVYNYPHCRWRDESVPVFFHVNPEGLPPGCGVDAVRRGAEGWNSVAGSRFSFRYAGESPARPGVLDGVNVFGPLNPWPFSATWVAATLCFAHHEGDSLVLDECDTGFNTMGFQYVCEPRLPSSSADVQTVTLHEAGHWLRLRHVNTDAEILQVAQLLGRRRPWLGPGDRAGACHVYPSWGSARLEPPGGWMCPAGDADTARFTLTALDREGAPQAGVPAESVWVELTPGSPGGGAAPIRVPAAAPTDSSGGARVALARLAGPGPWRAARARAGGHELLPLPAGELRSLDLSGDGRVGPEDWVLVQPGDSGAMRGPDSLTFLAHRGHRTGPAGSPTPGRPNPRIEVSPTPFNTMLYILLEEFEAGPLNVDVLDVSGGVVRRLWSGSVGAGKRRLAWDGRTGAGRPAASGIYLLQVRSATGTRYRKVVRIRSGG